MRQELTIEQLKPGMYVDEVTQQSGELQIKSKGIIKTEDAINLLEKKGVQRLVVDWDKSLIDNPDNESHSAEEFTDKESAPEATNSTRETNNTSFDQEIHKAVSLYDQALSLQKNIFSKAKTGKAIESETLKACANDLVNSAMRNQDAIACMTRLRSKNNYLMEHSVNCSILMALFSEHMGFDKELTGKLSTAALVADIGMIAVPDNILSKDTLTDSDWQRIHSHVELGCNVLAKSKAIDKIGLAMIQEHHERIDGSGYPAGLRGDQISLYGKMFAIVDVYDAVTADRPYRKAKTPMAAFKILRGNATSQFDVKLVNEFINCIGIHPVGTLVKLSNQKLGIIVASNPNQPLKPKVNVFYSVQSKCHVPPKIVDLSSPNCRETIEMSVLPEEFKIDMIKFFKQVLLS